MRERDMPGGVGGAFGAASRWACGASARLLFGVLMLATAAPSHAQAANAPPPAAAPAAAPAGAASAVPGAWDLSVLLAEIARRRSATARFAERQFLAMLDAPLDSTGELRFVAPSRLEKRTLKPRPETLVIDGDTLSVERQGVKRSMSIQSVPEAAALIESLRATLAGDRAALERIFRIRLDGGRDAWLLRLEPIERRARSVVRTVEMRGVRGDLEQVEISMADGDRSVMRILDTR